MTAFFHHLAYKFISFFVSIAMLFGIPCTWLQVDQSNWQTNYKYVFVHGLSGWGSYDAVYKLMPYWGMFGGDLMGYLNDKGFDAYAASVAGNTSAWDRACELYAQLTGTVVDYGEAHSARCNHARYGEDFTGRALIDAFDSENKINLLGHSFGGATVRLFASMMETGSEEERNTTTDGTLSPFFEGGKGDYIHSLVSLAAPHNGTTAYNIGEKPDADEPTAQEAEQLAEKRGVLDSMMDSVLGQVVDERISEDYAAYDMYIDNALALNETIVTLPNTYYFSIACCATEQQEDGTWAPTDKVEFIYRDSSVAMGKYTGATKGGYVIDESWQMNDGLVNTISAKAPFGAPQKEYEEGNVQTGVWNIMPIMNGDHMALQGGLLKTGDIKDLYVDLLSMINTLAD